MGGCSGHGMVSQPVSEFHISLVDYLCKMNQIVVILVKFKGHLLVGQFSIDRCKCGGSRLDSGLILGAQPDLEDTTSIDFAACALALNFRGIQNIFQNGILDGGQRPTSRTQSLRAMVSGKGLAENRSLSND